MTSAPAQTVRFAEPHRMLPRDLDATVAALLGDLDGDGDLDALVATAGNRPERVARNDGNGVSLADPSLVPATRTYASHAALGDVDGEKLRMRTVIDGVPGHADHDPWGMEGLSPRGWRSTRTPPGGGEAPYLATTPLACCV